MNNHDSSLQVPWTDLRYLFGEIMYGGHITDDWDRRLCKTYLEEYMKPELVRNTPSPLSLHVVDLLCCSLCSSLLA